MFCFAREASFSWRGLVSVSAPVPARHPLLVHYRCIQAIFTRVVYPTPAIAV